MYMHKSNNNNLILLSSCLLNLKSKLFRFHTTTSCYFIAVNIHWKIQLFACDIFVTQPDQFGHCYEFNKIFYQLMCSQYCKLLSAFKVRDLNLTQIYSTVAFCRHLLISTHFQNLKFLKIRLRTSKS